MVGSLRSFGNKTHACAHAFVHPGQALPSDAVVGFTTVMSWIGYSPAKNSIEEALRKIKAGNAPMCPATAEADMYNVCSEILRRHGCHMGMTSAYKFSGIDIAIGPRLCLSPHFALTRRELDHVIPNPARVVVSSQSTLIIRGDGEIIIEDLDLVSSCDPDTSASVLSSFQRSQVTKHPFSRTGP